MVVQCLVEMDFLNCILLLVSFCLIYYNFRSKKYPPGPISLPIVGNLSIIKKLSKQHNGLPNAFQELCKKYNTDVLSLMVSGNYTVVVQSEALIDEVLREEPYQGRPNHFFIRLRSMGVRRGITMTDGHVWKEQRLFAMKHLHEHGLGKRKMEFMIQGQYKEMLLDLEKCNLSNFTLRKYISKCVLNVLWEMVTGSAFRDEKTMNKLMLLMETRAKSFDVNGGLLSQFPWIRYIFPNYSGYNLIQELNYKFMKMIMEIINDHKKTYMKDKSRDFIDAYLHEMYQNTSLNSTFTDEQLIMVCLDFFIGGSQTTSSTLDFCFLYMTIHQDVQENVQKELDNVLLPGQIPSIDDKDRCPYVEAVLLEVQRKAPVAPIIGPRRTTSDTFLNGYFIPKDTTVLLNIQTVHDNKEKWEDSETFKPERFLNQGKVTPNPKLYNFGKGKRRCPAEILAKASIFIIFCGILHNYKLVANEENPPTVKKVPGITVSPAEYSIKLIRRSKCNNN